MPRDMIIVNVEIDVAVETITTTNEPIQVRNEKAKGLGEFYLNVLVLVLY